MTQPRNPKILVIVGPTASGKKQFAFEAAQRFDGEIVSADSRKVYRYLDIGTAKPSRKDREAVPHHLIDIVDPDEEFSAGEWVRRAAEAVGDILARGKLPVISGGTGFYIRAFQDGLSAGIGVDPEIRKRIEQECDEHGIEWMYRTLAEVDPERAEQLHANDTFRITRALEIFYSSGRTFTELRDEPKISGGEYDYLQFGLEMERTNLYNHIDERVNIMIENGLVQELKNILDMGYGRELTSLDTVGYKEWFPYLDDAASFENCTGTMKRNTRRYAKRQITWFRTQPDIKWIDSSDSEAKKRAFDEVESWLNPENNEIV